jgi:uncharacterized hydrophobic protein (TIGR00271 family)
VLHLRVYGHSAALAQVGQGLEDGDAARHVVVVEGVRPGHALLTAEVYPGSADAVLEFLRSHGLPHESVALARVDEIGGLALGRENVSLIWADVLGQASQYARPVARYLIFMIAAGVIAAFGVIEANQILIVGAMAVSPDTLPINATCIGLASRHLGLARHAFATLVVGLAATAATAVVLAAVLDFFDLLPSGFDVGESALSGLTNVNDATVGVAFAAGVAGMLALETRASSAVGVAISITTIPAAAYLGVAIGVGEADKVPGALAVLAVNVAILLMAGTATLIVQRWLAARGRPSRAARDAGGSQP